MIREVKFFFSDSIKGRMVLNVAFIHAIMMGVVIYDLSSRQAEFVQKEQTKKGAELASILAANSADSMLRNDIVAMEELIDEISSVKEADLVFLLDTQGKIRAASDKSYFNTIFSDEISKSLLKKALQSEIKSTQSVHDHFVDTFHPVKIKGETIGFVRILLSNKNLEKEFGELFKSGVVYAVIAIFAGSFLAFLMIARMSRDIDALTEAAKKISQKEFDAAVPKIKGKNEIAILAKAFSVMAESIRKNIRELQKSEQKMKWQATHDPLTGLNNRAGFEKAIEVLIEESVDFHTKHALLFLDLDKFKVVNDTAGHLAGDELLRGIARLMQKNIRQNDLLFRFGGDEFGILLKDCSVENATSIGQKLIDSVAKYDFAWKGDIFNVGLSIGLVQIDEYSQNATNVLSLADTACYMAKDKGRGRIFVADMDDKNTARHREEMGWIYKIEDALKNDKFELYAQKIESLNGDLKNHYEILLRLNTDQNEVVLPGSFIPAAERYMMMPSIDIWVAKRLFDYLRANRGIADNCYFSVNLSGQSINDDIFLTNLKELMSGNREFGKNIIFEITERVAISNHEEANKFISSLREFECRFALDDFGSGNSSFSYLKNLSVDFLKIDGSIVVNIFENPIDEVFVEAVTKIANKNDMKVVAEYVENDTIKEKMLQMGVHYAQGFGIQKPLPLALID